MLIEVGPRTIGKCYFKYDECKAKTFSIVKKALLAKTGESVWVCQSCLMKKAKDDYREMMRSPNPLKDELKQELT